MSIHPGAPMAHELTVGILNYNTADEVLSALGTLPDALQGVEARIVVLDNASRDDSGGCGPQRRASS